MRVVRAITITSFWLLASLPLEGATLTWDPNPEPDVLGYMVSYGTQPGVHTTQVDVGKVVVFSLTPPAGQTYYVVVQAYNAADISPKSDELVLSSASPDLVQDRSSLSTGPVGSEVSAASQGSAAATAPVSRSTPDIAVNGDFDGDGLDDPGAFTPSIGEWRLWLSSVRYAPAAPMIWGAQDDVPVPADYDGDGRTDLAVFRPSTGTWLIVMSNRGTPSRLDVAWGRQDDSPMPFDYDHDGKADLALRRSGGFDILLSTSNYAVSVTVR